MSDGRVIARARVIAMVEVDLTSTWGTDCALDQVHKQAVDEAIGKLKAKFNLLDFRLIGTPKVETIITRS